MLALARPVSGCKNGEWSNDCGMGHTSEDPMYDIRARLGLKRRCRLWGQSSNEGTHQPVLERLNPYHNMAYLAWKTHTKIYSCLARHWQNLIISQILWPKHPAIVSILRYKSHQHIFRCVSEFWMWNCWDHPDKLRYEMQKTGWLAVRLRTLLNNLFLQLGNGTWAYNGHG